MAVPLNIIPLAWVLVAMKKILEVVLGLHPVAAMGVCLALTLAYSVLSGLWGVVVTDFLQFAIATAGAIVLAVMAVGRCGGLEALRTGAEQASPLSVALTRFFPHPPEGTTPLDAAFWEGPVFAFAVFVFVQWWANKNADGGSVVVQRMLASRNERESLLATLWFNIANYALRPWPWILVALATVVLLPDAPHEKAYVQVMMQLAPAGLMGLMLASFLGAFMSTVDTHLNLSAAYLVNDLYRRFMVRDASQRHYVAVSRAACVFVMTAAALLALVKDSISGLYIFLLSFTSGFGLVLILRWFWWRVNAWSEVSAMTASGFVSTGLYFLKEHVWPEELAWMGNQWILLLTVVVSTAVWLAVTLLTSPVSAERLAAFYRKVRPYGAWGPVARHAEVRPPQGLWRLVVKWLAGTVMVLAATFAIGAFVLARPVTGCLYTAAALVGAVIIWALWDRDFAAKSAEG